MKISALWNAHLGLNGYISPQDVPLMLGLIKLARISQNPKNLDNYVDWCGYGALAGEVSLYIDGKNKMNILTIETFETFYSTEYSLRRMITEAYIRDPRFEVIGVGIKVDNNPTEWCSGSDVEEFLFSFDYRHTAVLAHNTVFDGAILSWKYGIQPKLWLDTLSMARPFHHSTVGGSLDALTKYYKLGLKGTEIVNAKNKRLEDFSTRTC